jgi:NADH-quinone oxidoreductase subunit H
MQAFLDTLIGEDVAPLLRQALYLGGMVTAGAIVVFGFVLPVAGVTSWLERRVWGRIQSRIGPNRVGPQGFLQWLADGLKNLLKEDIVPDAADPLLFRIAPYVVVVGFVAAFVAVPFAGPLIIADLNIGILYITAMTSLVVVGILVAGWASNNKWSMLGGIRSATQIISYEIPASLSIFPAVLLSGTLSMQGIIAAQGWQPWTWHMFHSPFSLAAFILFFVAALAEGNRTPFDLPEAESELVAGFATEYSGMRSLLFFLAEWGNLYLIGALVATLYMGGWQVPAFTDNVVVLTAAQFGVFFLKSYFWAFVAMWVRATLPRVRVDQLMSACWKYLVPLGLLTVLGTATVMVVVPDGAAQPMRYAMVGFVGIVLLRFFWRVRFHLKRARALEYSTAL